MSIAALVDGWAYALMARPEIVAAQRADDRRVAVLTEASRMAFGEHHSRPTARALQALLDAQAPWNPQALSARQFHVLLAIAGAELLGRDQLATFLTSYRDPGVTVWYRPVSVTALRQALHTVLSPYPRAKRLRLLTSLASQMNEELLRSAPSTTPFPAEFLAHYFGHSDPRVRVSVAENVHTPPHLLTKHATDDRPEVREAVAGNPATDPGVLEQLAEDPDILVRLAAGGNPTTQRATLAKLAADPTWTVRVAVAWNANTGSAVRTQLAVDAEWQVRATVAECAATDPALLAALARDRLANVREGVARNPHASRRLLDALCQDRSWNVRNEAMRHPHVDPAFIRDGAVDADPAVRAAAASNPNLADDLVLILGADPDWSVRRAIAANPRTNPRTVALLASDTDAPVRAAIAQRCDVTPEMLAMFASDRDRRIRLAVAEHPDTPPTAVTGLRDDIDRQVAAVATGASALDDSTERYRVALGTYEFSRRILTSPTINSLTQALQAIAAGARPKPREVRDAPSLPSFDDLAYPTASAAQLRLRNARVPVRVLPNGRTQRRNGIEMDNCTLTDPYITACQLGTTIVAAFTYEDERYNISWRHDGLHWTRRDLKGVSNREAPPAVEEFARELTMALDGLQPEPAQRFPGQVISDELGITLGPASASPLAHDAPGLGR